MISKLILIRHGKAQEATIEMSDKERELSKSGRRAWKAHCVHMLRPLLKDAKPQIWTSPALRAKQTAEELALALNVSEIEEVPDLYDGNFGAITSALGAAEGYVVLVGHEPYMSNFCAQLNGGTNLYFGTGASCAFEVTPPENFEGRESRESSENLEGRESRESSENFEGCDAAESPENQSEPPTFGSMQFRLLWFVQGPKNARWKTICQLEEGFKRASERIGETSARLLELPDDAEALHKYRISLRIARSLLAFSRPWLKNTYCRRLDASLQALQAPTSKVREMDILLLALEAGSISAMLATRERYMVRVGFIEMMQLAKTQRALQQACDKLRKPRWKESIESEGLESYVITQRLMRLQDAQDKFLKKIDYSDKEAVHAIRKKAKALRYAARENADCLPKDCKQVSTQMEAVQDKLGELCDAWVNEALMINLPCKEASDLAAAQRARADEIIRELEAEV